jgi:antitoxin HicB
MNRRKNSGVMRFVYPAEVWHAGPDEVVVSFRDIERCHTSGKDESEALVEAQDALEEAIAKRIDDGEPIPTPSAPLPGEHLVAVPADMAAKAAFALAFRASGLTRVVLAERLGTDEKSVRRMLNPRHGTTPSRINRALRVLGSELVVEVREIVAV